MPHVWLWFGVIDRLGGRSEWSNSRHAPVPPPPQGCAQRGGRLKGGVKSRCKRAAAGGCKTVAVAVQKQLGQLTVTPKGGLQYPLQAVPPPPPLHPHI